jgi:hypothetical protein
MISPYGAMQRKIFVAKALVSFPSVYGARRENELGVFAKVSSDRTIMSGTLPSSHSVTSHWLHFHFES